MTLDQKKKNLTKIVIVEAFWNVNNTLKFDPFISQWMNRIFKTLSRVTLKTLNDLNPFGGINK